MIVFWDVALCSLAENDPRSRRAYCLYHQGNESTNALTTDKKHFYHRLTLAGMMMTTRQPMKIIDLIPTCLQVFSGMCKSLAYLCSTATDDRDLCLAGYV